MKSLFKKIVVGIITFEAKLVLKKYKPKIIAVTGSVGKTSTKDAIYTILENSVHVRKSDKSFNSEIGVPLTILGLQNGWSNPLVWIKNIFEGLEIITNRDEDFPKVLVLEVGADHPNDIKSITKWLKPDVAIVTMVSAVPVHIEFFPSRKEVLEEKSALLRAVKPGGTMIVPLNDPDLVAVTKEVQAAMSAKKLEAKVLTFGTSADAENGANVYFTNPSIFYELAGNKPQGMNFILHYGAQNANITLSGVLGVQPIYSVLIAATATLGFGSTFSDIIKEIPKYKAPKGRMNVLEGINGAVLIDDTYNSSPAAAEEALKLLGSVQFPVSTTGRKIAILGDMMELGKFSLDEHRRIGRLVPEHADMLITVGIRSRDLAEAAKNSVLAQPQARASHFDIKMFETSVEAAEYVKTIVTKGDIVLIKGSQSPRLEKITKALLLDPSKAGNLLVRQEEEWVKR